MSDKVKKFLFIVLALVHSLFLRGEDAATDAIFIDNVPNYTLQPSDLVKVEVFQEPDLLKEIRISADGTVVLPLIGKIKIGGLTIEEAQRLIRELYDRDYIVNPQVNLLILEYNPRFVQVLGQVNRPGFVAIRPEKGLTLVEAIAGANGFTRLGKKNAVRLKRKDKDGTIIFMKVDVEKILRAPEIEDIDLQEGDVIFVDEKIF